MMKSFANSKIIKRVQQLKESELYFFFRPIQDSSASKVIVNNKEQIMIGSNNYLGLTHHPYVIEKSIAAIKKYGTGCTGSRVLNGNLDIHEELEERLAKFIGHEKALVFATGMQSNLGAISCIAGPRDCLLFDSENHASIIDASRLSFSTTFKYKHNNMKSLEELLIANQNKFQKMIIVADGVFSMTGDIMKLPDVVALAKKYNAYIYVDDAHGLGVLGEKGQGTASHFGETENVDFNMGTFSKSFASIGGYVSGKKESIDFIKHSARSFIFSAAMPPSAVATVLACLDIVEKDHERFENLKNNVQFMLNGFKDIDLFTYGSTTPIIPVYIGDDLTALKVTQRLTELGIFATPVLPPAVPQGESLIRTSYMAIHQKEELQKVVDAFRILKKEFNLPGKDEVCP